MRRNFHDHVILVQRPVHGRDLPLSERVVESVVQGLRSNAQTAGGITIDHELGLQSFILLVRILVAQFGNVFSFCNSRGAQVFRSSRFALCSVYWYCALPYRPPMVSSCADCKIRVAPGTTANLPRRRLITSSAVG